jgi:Escherichia/Staphylococcus phage prohead protease
MSELFMQLRSADVDTRIIEGIVAPYDETSYLTPDPAGERIMRGAFAKSIRQRETRIPLCRAHDHARAIGMSRRWTDAAEGLAAEFHIRPSTVGDEALEEARDGYLSGLSVGFEPLVTKRAPDHAIEVREARLLEVSLCVIAAYDGARVLSVRNAQELDELLAPFRNPPHVDLSPLPAIWAYDSPVRPGRGR